MYLAQKDQPYFLKYGLAIDDLRSVDLKNPAEPETDWLVQSEKVSPIECD
ncbi:hypothetical protein AGMMS49949_05940 [Alphaproteobacteria bacterium]|nr:hypothetical protein AGMMS49949_05940 [Alphaproteobacteria bacterium]GHT00209.1 hypothetical protein AGMMS50296_8490 [Alphaproteobacteria bacterium]